MPKVAILEPAKLRPPIQSSFQDDVGRGDILSASVAVAAGQVVLADMTALANPYKGPMYLDEIRFQFASTTAVAMRVELRYQSELITQSFTPIPVLSKVLDAYQENGGMSGNAGLNGPGFTWRLPKPLWIPRDGVVTARFFHAGTGSVVSSTLRVAYVVRAAPARPQNDEINVPFVAAYVGQGNVGGANYIEQSRAGDLVNTYQTPIFLERLNGRMQIDDSSAGGSTRFIDTYVQSTSYNGIPEQRTTVTIMSSTGAAIVRDPTIFSQLFQPFTKTWKVNAVIAPKAYYTVTLEQTLSSYASTVTVRPIIAMVGYRKVRY